MQYLTRRRLFQSLAAAGTVLPASLGQELRIVRSARPEDYEMPLSGFSDWITPADRFFVRSHHYTPQVDIATWRLSVGGQVTNRLSFSLEDLKEKFQRVELVGVLECAGNGRALYEPPVIGLQWEQGAVANGRWAGVRLADVLSRAGLKPAAREVLLDGADTPVGKMPEFQRSIPVTKALHPDTLLAYQLNESPLPVSNGFPLRLVAPGWAGDCWVKWLTGITVLDREFDGFFMKTAYRHPGKAVRPGAAVDPAEMEPVTELAVKCVIAAPLEGVTLAAGQPVRISGAAWSGTAPVTGVEVSTDRGRSWRPARLGRDSSRYSWRLWDYDWRPSGRGYHTLMARARDAAGRVQPSLQEWNPSGYLYNVVPAVSVEIGERAAPPPPAAAEAPAPVEVPAQYKTACLACHGEDVIAQQRLTRAQWDREVTKMTNWGAPVTPGNREDILRYLVSRFGPRPRR